MTDASHPVDWAALLESIDGDAVRGELTDAFIAPAREFALIAGLWTRATAALRESACTQRERQHARRRGITAAASSLARAGSGQRSCWRLPKNWAPKSRTIEYLRATRQARHPARIVQRPLSSSETADAVCQYFLICRTFTTRQRFDLTDFLQASFRAQRHRRRL